MSSDFGNFFAQIFSVLVVYLGIPTAILIVWFTMLRPYLKKRRAEKDGDAVTKSATQPMPVYDAVREPTTSKIDSGMLPDLDTILRGEEAYAQPAKRDGIFDVTLNTGQRTQAKEMFVVLRDEQDGRMMVQIEDTAYRSLKGTPDAKRIFTSVMKELSATILQDDIEDKLQEEITPNLGDLAKQTQTEPETPEPTSPALSSDDDEAQKPEQATLAEKPLKRTTTELPTLADGTLPGDLPSYKFDDNPAKIEKRRSGRIKVDFVPPPDLDIPSAIEAYLQYKIQYTPEFQNRNIHVLPAIDGGVRIRVEETYFEGVSDITDDMVREFLQETIAEWQERQ